MHLEPPGTDGPPAAMFKRVNLNLLYSLYAILNSESLSHAAKLVSLTQPAMSQALKKLREEFDDELFYHEAGERKLTALAEALRPRVERALQDAREAFSLRLTFDPAQSTRNFTIAAPEAILTMFVGPMVAPLLAIAPAIRLSFVKLDNAQQERAIESDVDVRIVPNNGADIHGPQTLLYKDELVCLAWDGNDRYGDLLSLDQLAQADLVGGEGAMLPRSLLGSPLNNVVGRRGFAVVTSSLAALPGILAGTQLIALVPSWLAQYLAEHHPLQLLSLSNRASRTIDVYAQWHARHAGDPAITWLVDQLLNRVRTLLGPEPRDWDDSSQP